MSDYQDIYDKVCDILEREEKDDTNILHILNRSDDENSHSALICRLLNVLPYRKYFFEFLNLDNEPEGIFETEKSTEDKRRMDIFLETGEVIICIENKIYAGDQNNQLSDYYEEIQKRRGRRKVRLVYLTLEGRKPSEDSMEESRWAQLKTKKEALCLSYKEIKRWLSRCLPLKKGISEGEHSLLKQYAHCVDYLILSDPNNRELEKDIIKTFKGREINNLDDWRTLYQMGEHKDFLIKQRLTSVIRLIGKETAERLIQKTPIPKNFLWHEGAGIEYYIRWYESAGKPKFKEAMSLQLFYRYRKDLSPFTPYIWIYIPKVHYSALLERLEAYFERTGLKSHANENQRYIYVNVKPEDNTKLLKALDKIITNYFKEQNIALV